MRRGGPTLSIFIFTFIVFKHQKRWPDPVSLIEVNKERDKTPSLF
jgi:hypothetical protein